MLCPLCGESIGADQRACGACGYAPTDTERSAAGAPSLPPPSPQRPSRPLTLEAAPVVVIEQTRHESYWVSAPTTQEIAREVRQVTIANVRDARRARTVMYVASLAAAAAVVAAVPPLVEVRALQPVPTAGDYHLIDLFTNNVIAVIVAACVLIAASALAMRGSRFGVGLAGGSGLALAAFVGFQYGRVRVVEAITARSASGQVDVAYQLGFWVLVAAGGLGLVTAIVALTPTGSRAARPSTNAVLALAGGLGTTAMALGPLIPVDGGTFADNWSTGATPTAFVVARFAVLAALVTSGVIGFASRRAWGIGLALGGMSIAGWQWLSSFGKIGDAPAGVGGRNPVATDVLPHAVTTIGFVVAFLAAVVSLIATWRSAS